MKKSKNIPYLTTSRKRESPASVTIPNSVTSIWNNAFAGTGLTSVTFQGRIASDKFGGVRLVNGPFYSPFYGDLRDKYLVSDGGPGTYKRFSGGEVWKKQ